MEINKSGGYVRRVHSFQEQIRDSNIYYQTFINHIRDALFLISPQGVILEVNNSACEMLEYSREELLLKYIHELCPLQARQDRAKARMCLAKLREQGNIFDEVFLLTKSDRQLTAELSASSMPDGNCLGTVRDITARKQMEQKLIESEGRYRKFVELSPEAIVVHSDGIVQYVNPAGVKIAGVDNPADLIGKKLMDFVHPDFKRIVEDRIVQATNKNMELPLIEEKIILQDGSTVDGEVAAVPVDFEGKKSVMVFIRNISERKNSERILIKREQELKDQLSYAHALNHMAERIIGTEDIRIILETATWIISQTLNLDYAMIYEVDYLKNELRLVCQHQNGNNPPILVPDGKHKLNINTNAKILFLKEKVLLESHHDAYNTGLLGNGMTGVIHNHFKVQSFFWYPFSFGQNGYYALAFAQITEKRTLKENEQEFVGSALKLVEIAIQKVHYFAQRVKIEESLKSTEKEKELILSSISELVVFHDRNLLIRWVNTAAQESLGIPLESLVGRHCYEIWQGSSVPCPGCPVLKALSTGEKHKNEMGTPDGKIWSVKGFPVFNEEGEIIGAVEIAKDITEAKKMEREMARLERLNLIGEMAASFGHEIRNPMATVRGFLQILESKRECYPFKDYFDLMIEEMDRANSIISEFLSMAKHKAVDLKENNLTNIIQALFPLILADAIHSDKSVQLQLQEIPNVRVDRKETHQLILNLVRNGLEAMNPGGNLTIRTYTEDEEVILAIQDQGSGIKPEIMNKLGLPFVTTKENGTGLGLAICYSIVQRHNARMDVQSGPEGTTFLIRYKKAV